MEGVPRHTNESSILKAECTVSWQTSLFSDNICKDVKEVTRFPVNRGESELGTMEHEDHSFDTHLCRSQSHDTEQ